MRTSNCQICVRYGAQCNERNLCEFQSPFPLAYSQSSFQQFFSCMQRLPQIFSTVCVQLIHCLFSIARQFCGILSSRATVSSTGPQRFLQNFLSSFFLLDLVGLICLYCKHKDRHEYPSTPLFKSQRDPL